LKKLKDIVTFFHSSPTKNYQTIAKQNNLKDTKFIQSNDTRWISSQDMLESVAFAENALTIYYLTYPGNFELPTAREFKASRQMFWVSDCLADATSVLQASSANGLLMSAVYPVLSILEVRLSSDTAVEIFKDPAYREEDWEEINEENLEIEARVLRQNLRADLKSVISSWSDDQILLICIITLLDPRFKSLSFLKKETRRLIYAELKDMTISFALKLINIEKQAAGSAPAAEVNAADDDLDDDISEIAAPHNPKRYCRGSLNQFVNSVGFEEDSSSSDEDEKVEDLNARLRQSVSERFEIEWLSCKKEKAVEVSADALQWWKCRESRYPLISQMAKAYLAIFASSADVERLFSTGGLVVSPLRTSLHSSKVENILFCNRNIDRFDINEILDELVK
jgi:hypothetical protein